MLVEPLAEPRERSSVHSARVTAGTRVGRYRLLSLLGRGGMGEVWRAEDESGRAVALKRLHAFEWENDWRARFDREVRALFAVQHPAVVRALDHGQDADGRPWLAMELLTGTELAARLDRGPLPIAEVLEIGRAIAGALEAAHGAGIVHRDLKPGNVFLTSDGPKVLDFGVSRTQDDAARLTMTGAVIGTPGYMPPEQADGRREVGPAADLYSLGAVLHHCLAGEPPFSAPTPIAVLVRVLTEDPPDLGPLRPDAPRALVLLIRELMAKSPADRPQGAAAVLHALSAVETGPSLEATAVTVVARPESTGRSPRLVSVVFAQGVRDVAAFARESERRGGRAAVLRDGIAVAVFGDDSWTGEEPRRAWETALAVAPAASRVAVGTGRAVARAGEVAGAAVEAARAALPRAAAGSPAMDEATRRHLLGAERAAPLVGRDGEMAHLSALVQRVTDDREPTAVVLAGPPGVGKSRLVRELSMQLRSGRFGPSGLSGGEVPDLWELRGEAGRAFTPLGALAHAVRGRAGIDESTPAEGRRAALVGLLGDEARAASVGEIVGAGFPATERLAAARADARALAEQVRVDLRAWLEASARPVVWVFEDVHFADAESVDLVGKLLRDAPRAAWLVLGTVRWNGVDAARAAWAGGDVQLFEVRALGIGSTRRLAESTWGAPLPEAFTSALHDRSGGVPLVVEEIVAQLREEGADPLAVRTADLPSTAEGAVQARLDGLPAAERDLCVRASIFGRAFHREALFAIGALDPAPTLAALARREVLQRRPTSRLAGTEEWWFRHGVVQEVAHRSLADEDRAPLHLAAGRWLAGRPDAEPETVAEHLLAGAEPAEAAPFALRAARAARARGDLEAWLRFAQAAASHLPAGDDGFAALEERTVAIRALGRAAELPGALEALDALARRVGGGALARAAAARAVAAAYGARWEEAREAAVRAEALARGTAEARALVEALSARALVSSADGDDEVAIALYREGSTCAREAGMPAESLRDRINGAVSLLILGATAEAASDLTEASAEGRRLGFARAHAYAENVLGLALERIGRVDEALAAEDRAEALVRDLGDARLGMLTRLYRARILCEAGRAAGDAADAAVAAATGDLVAQALAIRALVRVAAGDGRGALADAERALGLRDEAGGMEECEAELLLAHARALAAVGRREEAERASELARAFVKSRADRIRDPRTRERFCRDVPVHRAALKDQDPSGVPSAHSA